MQGRTTQRRLLSTCGVYVVCQSRTEKLNQMLPSHLGPSKELVVRCSLSLKLSQRFTQGHSQGRRNAGGGTCEATLFWHEQFNIEVLLAVHLRGIITFALQAEEEEVSSAVSPVNLHNVTKPQREAADQQRQFYGTGLDLINKCQAFPFITQTQRNTDAFT